MYVCKNIRAVWWMMANFYCARISILQANETPLESKYNILSYYYNNNNMHIAHVHGGGDKTMGNVTGSEALHAGGRVGVD